MIAKEIALGLKAVEKAHERTGGRGKGGCSASIGPDHLFAHFKSFPTRESDNTPAEAVDLGASRRPPPPP